MSDVVDPAPQLCLGRQVAKKNQVRNFEEGALLRQLLDGIAPVTEDSFVAINKRDGALARRCIHKGRIIGHNPEILGTSLDLSQVHGANGALLNGDIVSHVGALVDDIQELIWHSFSSSEFDRRMPARLTVG